LLEHERAWRELRGVWDRGGWTENNRADRAAFDRACRQVAPEAIVEVAKVCVAAYAAGDGVKFLPKLHMWLADRGWEKAPPAPKRAKRQQRASGWHDAHRPRTLIGYIMDRERRRAAGELSEAEGVS
jgi:hypothetical protein